MTLASAKRKRVHGPAPPGPAKKKKSASASSVHRLKSEDTNRVKSENATRLKSEDATRLKGENATRLKGENATRLKGENATRLKHRVDQPVRCSPEPERAEVEQADARDREDETESKDTHLQIVTGSYERILHGFAVRVPDTGLRYTSATTATDRSPSSSPHPDPLSFTDTFLFAAHSSAIRCLAISPPAADGHSDRRYLATGSSDERINIYHLSTAPPPPQPPQLPLSHSLVKPQLSSPDQPVTAENPRNRSIGTLNHHDRAITSLYFPTKSKLVSAAEDATIAIARTRDWTVLSSMKAPIPSPQGRPSGDTAAPGEIPAGVNHFAIHPSQKLMLSVGKGEKCMRLWNLMTGKKAGVLNFDRHLLSRAGEGKFGSGEGRFVRWDHAGENFVVIFEKAAVLFGLDCQPRAVLKPYPATKIHQAHFLPRPLSKPTLLALSTEDGCILFFRTDIIGADTLTPTPTPTNTTTTTTDLPILSATAQLGGAEAGVTRRVKDFNLLRIPARNPAADAPWLAITGSSDGTVRLWLIWEHELTCEPSRDSLARPVGRLLGTHETGHRITCLAAFFLDGRTSPLSVAAPMDNEDGGTCVGIEEEEEEEE